MENYYVRYIKVYNLNQIKAYHRLNSDISKNKKKEISICDVVIEDFPDLI